MVTLWLLEASSDMVASIELHHPVLFVPLSAVQVGMCPLPLPCDYGGLRERCEKLEQVAKDMYQWCDGIVNRYWTIVPEQLPKFKEQLEELGVEIDD